MIEIDLRSGYLWDCPDCGHTNYVERYLHEVDPPKEESLKPGEMVDLENGDQFHMMGYFESGPVCNEVLFCGRCETKFKAKPPEPLDTD